MTTDIVLMVAVDAENEAKVFSALSILPDNDECELQPGELQQYNVVRVGDEILVDFMRSAGALIMRKQPSMSSSANSMACRFLLPRPRFLWRMKVVTHRKKTPGIWCSRASGWPNAANNCPPFNLFAQVAMIAGILTAPPHSLCRLPTTPATPRPHVRVVALPG